MRSALAIKPRWMSSRQASRFLSFKSGFERKLDPAHLTPRERNALALLEFVQKNHSAHFPSKPEFPPWNPRFPATPIRKIRVPGLERLTVLLKDESVNPTGTHKDRMAWEIVREYHHMLKQKAVTGRPIPPISIVSSGNAAIAIADMMRRFGGPPIRVLVDGKLDRHVLKKMEAHAMRIFSADLSKKDLSSDDILRLTRNSRGIDLTRGKFARFLSRDYYDWMAFEILNARPDFVVLPYGTGQLFENIFDHYHRQLKELKADPRLQAQRVRHGGLNLIGVSAPLGSVADKLSAPFLSDSTKREYQSQKRNIVAQLISQGVLGEHSRIEELEDRWFFEASRLSQRLKLRAEPSALAGIAWLLKHKKEIRGHSRVLVVNTGKGVFPED